MTEEQIQTKAQKAAGNWEKFDSFIWSRQPEDSEDWCLVNLRTRDSEPVERANARAIEKIMEPHTRGRDPDADLQRFNHWGFGWVDAVAIRVSRDGKVTDAFREMCSIQDQLEQYPVLDDELLTEEESEDQDG